MVSETSFRRYFFKRALNSILMWILVLILNFFLFYVPSTRLEPEPFPVQLVKYFKYVFLDRLGPYGPLEVATLDYILSVSTYSLILLAISLVTAIAMGTALATLTFYKALDKGNRKVDAALTVATILPFAVPVWWVALTLRAYLSPPFPAFFWYSERWLFQSPMSDIPVFIVDFLNHLILPLAAFVLTSTGIYFIVTRNSLRRVYAEDFIRTAYAKGLSPVRIMFKHALRNAMVQVVSTIALTPALLVVAIIMIERVFSRGGLGFMFLKSAIDTYSGDKLPPTPVLQGVFIVFATVIIIIQFTADILACFLDPRIRTDGAGLEIQGSKVERQGFSLPFHKKVLKLLKEFLRGYSGKLGLGIILFFAVGGLIVPYLPLTDPAYLGPERPSPNQPPNLSHPLGTDSLGRDVLSMILWGARASLLEGLGAVALALAIGCLVGLFSGYYDKQWIGYLLSGITDLFLALPIIVIAVYFPNVDPYSPTALKWILAVGLTTWPLTAKLVRAEVISAKEKPYIEASKAAGAGEAHILFRCLLPDIVPAAASSLLLLAVTALSIQSSLDFLGFERSLWNRIDAVLLAPYISWGTILSYGSASWVFRQWWTIFPPAICIALLGLALIAIGNKTMEMADPRLKKG